MLTKITFFGYFHQLFIPSKADGMKVMKVKDQQLSTNVFPVLNSFSSNLYGPLFRFQNFDTILPENRMKMIHLLPLTQCSIRLL